MSVFCRVIFAAVGCVVAAFWAGCSDSAVPEAGEVRGAPIQRRAGGGEISPAGVVAERGAGREVAGGGTVAGVGFDLLAGYEFKVSEEIIAPATNRLAEARAATEAQIPSNVKALHNRTVSIRGFMLPLKVNSGLVTELLILKDQSMCCYGAVPKLNEWVSITMTQGVKPVMDQPVTVTGKLEVGEIRENGYLIGLYRMRGEGVTGP